MELHVELHLGQQYVEGLRCEIKYHSSHPPARRDIEAPSLASEKNMPVDGWAVMAGEHEVCRELWVRLNMRQSRRNGIWNRGEDEQKCIGD
jgi:hypothetical protein